MRVLVVSDVHGDMRGLCEAIESQPTARVVIFLGDGIRQAEDAAERYPDRDFYLVPGNCDFGSDALPIRQETFGGKRFYFTHGHRHDVKYTFYRLEMAAREAEADIVLYGHTHAHHEEYVDGLYFFNPGSLRYDRTYGYVDIVGGELITAVVKLR